MKYEKLTFISGNEGKLRYLNEYLDVPVVSRKLDLVEIQSLDLEEIVIDKARRAYEIIKSPILVEDVALTFTELKSLPGPLIKWFLETLGNQGLCHLIQGSDRSARAEVKFAMCEGSDIHVFSGSIDGSIATEPHGDAGFGWDSIFIPHGYTKTWAEMTDDEKHESSMRKIALKDLKEFLTNLK